MKVQNYMVLICALLLIACKPTTRLEMVQPALVTLPDHIEVMATIDRSKPSGGFLNVLEGGLTGESIHQDREGRKRALQSLAATMTRTPRFKVIHTGLEYNGSKTGATLAQPMDWSEIATICEQYDADAVIAIEKFDTDNHQEVTSRKKKEKDKDGNETEVTVFDGRRNVRVNLGWRIYDLQTRSIVDEVEMYEEDRDQVSGLSTESEAISRLEDARLLTLRVSDLAGLAYGERIAPVWITVERTFYRKAKGAFADEMQKAARHFETDDWETAAEIWHRIEAQSGVDKKIRGMAAYNLAVAFEKQGMISTARDWAQRSYGQYGLKAGRRYADVLRNRLFDQELLTEQMKDRT